MDRFKSLKKEIQKLEESIDHSRNVIKMQRKTIIELENSVRKKLDSQKNFCINGACSFCGAKVY